MEKYRFDDIFSPSKESVKEFLILTFLLGPFCDILVGFIGVTDYLKSGEPIFNHLAEYAIDGCIEWAYFIICYFIARWLAYRTNVFPGTKIREGVHFMVFIILIILSFVLVLAAIFLGLV